MGKPAGKNPWKANSLEWLTPEVPPAHGNWGENLPAVHRWPYDFNVPGALAVLFDMAKSINSLKDSDQFNQANQLATILVSLARPLGVLQQDPEDYLKTGVQLSEDKIEGLIREREVARTNRDFKKSDQIRDELISMNIVLEDSADGTSWRRK